ncbi:hypothetical protein [Rhizobium rhizogenes]|uniref:Uncharacterized protein n=1 Tax=Rhizobium rhizogenes TaxID=359 RepID=A0AA92H7A9_RHIRH|nr:hypothetical protein [Rhizobium rhizogenes]PVE49872.1 hypothetical protein DC430_23525 [Rhizobium rhizogenes]PVE62002.1 hypothetical protein DC415_23935 [Agrobacterium tumefaciens]PVE69766.1 hypothetical protein DCP16_23935 [Sphingomonas sp. TPD3009]
MASLFNNDGKPDFAAIDSNFPLHDTGEITHRTAIGHRFRFRVERASTGIYNAIILEQPTYGQRVDGYYETHRLPHHAGLNKICFKTPAQDLPTAVAVTLWWAECTSKYISQGGAWS